MVSLTLITPPTKEPVSIKEVAEWLRLDSGYDENQPELKGLLAAARMEVENISGQSMMTQTWRMTRDRFPCSYDAILIPRGPLHGVNESPEATSVVIEYLDTAGDWQTWASDQYIVDTSAKPGRITPAYGIPWPSTRWQMNAVKITYVTGMDDPDDVSETLKLALRMLLASWHENREAVTESDLRVVPMHIQQMLANETIPNFRWED